MTVNRVIAALGSAVAAGVLTGWFASGAAAGKSAAANANTTGCCGDDGCAEETSNATGKNDSVLGGVRYAFTDLFNDIALWLLFGFVVAAAIRAFVPSSAMAQWGSGFLPMLAVVAVSFPMYVCATASTPIAASLLLSGVSPGTVLVFLLAGPASNLSSVGVVQREMGLKAAMAYVLGVVGTSVAIGLSLDWFSEATGLRIAAGQAEAGGGVPEWLALATGILFALLTAVAVVKRLGSWIGWPRGIATR